MNRHIKPAKKGITLSIQSPVESGNKKNTIAKTNPITIDKRIWFSLNFQLEILAITAGPNDEPIAVQAKSTLLKIFSGINNAIKTEAKITPPVISREILKELCFKPRSKLIDEEHTNI